MSRARRLSEIAKSNAPIFSGAQWWLADAAEKPASGEPAQPSKEEPSAEAPATMAAQITSPEPAMEQAEVLVEAVAARAPEAPAYAASAVAMEVSSEVAVAREREPESTDFASRMSSLREKFLWLGRRSRSVHQS
jgi:hypothetical protein